jgi:hypothetical protein
MQLGGVSPNPRKFRRVAPGSAAGIFWGLGLHPQLPDLGYRILLI